MNRLFFFSLLTLLSSSSIYAQTIYSAAKKFEKTSFLDQAQIALKIVDLGTNETVYEINADKIMPTASTTKLFSTAYALEQLGPAYRSKTILGHNGQIINNTLKGDLIIKSFGDVSLGSRYFTDKQDSFLNVWLQQLQIKGIQTIDGNIYVDGSVFGYEGSPADWQWGDIGNAYGAHFSGSNVYDNIVSYTFKTGKAGTVSELLYTSPAQQIIFDNRIISGKVGGDNSSLFGAPYSMTRYGTGELPENRSSFTIRGSMPDPEQTLSDEIKSFLAKNGISCHQASTTRIVKGISISDTLFIYEGKNLEQIMKVTNFESVNLFAEGLMRIAAFEKQNQWSHNSACTALEDFWKKKINSKNLILNDGSGLSRTNCISVTMLTDLLKYMDKSENASIFYNSLPRAGLEGTLKSVAKNKPAQGVMRAKSGSMRRVRSYAGYIETKSGKRLAFAIVSNNHLSTTKELINAMEDVFDAMANY